MGIMGSETKRAFTSGGRTSIEIRCFCLTSGHIGGSSLTENKHTQNKFDSSSQYDQGGPFIMLSKGIFAITLQLTIICHYLIRNNYLNNDSRHSNNYLVTCNYHQQSVILFKGTLVLSFSTNALIKADELKITKRFVLVDQSRNNFFFSRVRPVNLQGKVRYLTSFSTASGPQPVQCHNETPAHLCWRHVRHEHTCALSDT